MSKIMKNMIFYLILIVIPLSLLYFLAYPTYLKSKKINKSITFNEDKIEALSHLATLEVELSDFYEERKIAKKNWIRKDFFIRGFMMFGGRAKIGVNLNKIKVKILDKERRVAQINIPPAEIIFFELNPQVYQKVYWKNTTPQERLDFVNKARVNIKLTMRKELENSTKVMESARNRAKRLIKAFYRKLGWEIKFNSFINDKVGEL